MSTNKVNEIYERNLFQRKLYEVFWNPTDENEKMMAGLKLLELNKMIRECNDSVHSYVYKNIYQNEDDKSSEKKLYEIFFETLYPDYYTRHDFITKSLCTLAFLPPSELADEVLVRTKIAIIKINIAKYRECKENLSAKKLNERDKNLYLSEQKRYYSDAKLYFELLKTDLESNKKYENLYQELMSLKHQLE